MKFINKSRCPMSTLALIQVHDNFQTKSNHTMSSVQTLALYSEKKNIRQKEVDDSFSHYPPWKPKKILFHPLPILTPHSTVSNPLPNDGADPWSFQDDYHELSQIPTPYPAREMIDITYGSDHICSQSTWSAELNLGQGLYNKVT